MAGICYVIMPYGGSDFNLKRHYGNVFEDVIKPAAKGAGFKEDDIIREDREGTPGTILPQIIEHLVSAEVIIADITKGNANVYYELGIAHVVHKKATVMICDKAYAKEIPFDVSSQHYVQYSMDGNEKQEAIMDIATQIKKRKEGSCNADNVVHEQNPWLPTQLMTLSGEDPSETPHASANKHCKGKSSSLVDNDLIHTYREAGYLMRYSGDSLLTKLDQCINDQDPQGFLDVVVHAIKLNTIRDSEIRGVIGKLPALNNGVACEQVLELLWKSFPGSPYVIREYIKHLARIKQSDTAAEKLLNGIIGLKRNKGKIISVDPKLLNPQRLNLYVNTYLDIYRDRSNLLALLKYLYEQNKDKGDVVLICNITSHMQSLTQAPSVDKLDKKISEYRDDSYEYENWKQS